MKKINITDIHLSDYNPRILYEEDKTILKNSLTEFGLIDPIIVNLKEYNIIGGHQRYKLLVDEGVEDLNLIELGDIGWVFPNDNLIVSDDNSEKAMNLALNIQVGNWDYSKLNEIFNELNDNNFDIDLTGFDSISIETNVDDDFWKNGISNDFEFEDSDENKFEVIVTKKERIINIGNYTIKLPITNFNNWIRKLEFENDFNKPEIINEIKRRLGFETD